MLGDKEADKFMDLIESWNKNEPYVEASNACTRWKNVNEDKKVNDRLVEDRIENFLQNVVARKLECNHKNFNPVETRTKSST